MNVLVYPHTAHQLGSAKIIYRFHPFVDRQVMVIRRTNRSGVPAVLVRIRLHDSCVLAGHRRCTDRLDSFCRCSAGEADPRKLLVPTLVDLH